MSIVEPGFFRVADRGVRDFVGLAPVFFPVVRAVIRVDFVRVFVGVFAAAGFFAAFVLLAAFAALVFATGFFAADFTGVFAAFEDRAGFFDVRADARFFAAGFIAGFFATDFFGTVFFATDFLATFFLGTGIFAADFLVAGFTDFEGFAGFTTGLAGAFARAGCALARARDAGFVFEPFTAGFLEDRGFAIGSLEVEGEEHVFEFIDVLTDLEHVLTEQVEMVFRLRIPGRCTNEMFRRIVQTVDLRTNTLLEVAKRSTSLSHSTILTRRVFNPFVPIYRRGAASIRPSSQHRCLSNPH